MALFFVQGSTPEVHSLRVITYLFTNMILDNRRHSQPSDDIQRKVKEWIRQHGSQ